MSNTSITPTDLLHKHKDAWYAATHHPFLEGVRDGSLSSQVFATWLVQDYHFVLYEIASLGRLLGRAPRFVQNILVRALAALEAEATWFETHAHQRGLALDVPLLAATAAYRDFFVSLDKMPFPVALAAVWAVERAYLASWMNVAPGHQQYRPYVEHWANVEFEQFVLDLEQVAATALAEWQDGSVVEKVFLTVAQLEKGFWDMAWSGGDQ